MSQLTADPTSTPTAPACPVYTWCTESGTHEVHTSEVVALDDPGRDPELPPLIQALVLVENGRDGIIGFGEADLTPAELRAKIEELRAVLPRLEALANTAEAAALR